MSKTITVRWDSGYIERIATKVNAKAHEALMAEADGLVTDIDDLGALSQFSLDAIRDLGTLQEAARDVLNALRQWHEAHHSPNRPPYLDCTGCHIWPMITKLRDALGETEPRAWSEIRREEIGGGPLPGACR